MATGGPRHCRSCGDGKVRTILDLGSQPVADLLVSADNLAQPDVTYPLRLGVCSRCWLVQLADDDVDVPAAAHGHGSTFSRLVTADADAWAAELVRRLALDSSSTVAAVGSQSDDVLLRFRKHGIGAVAFAPNETPARPVDLVVAQHALAHYPDLDEVVRAMSGILTPRGAIAIEFHHVLSMVVDGQFDIACHAHRSYLSMISLEHTLTRHGLAIEDAWTTPMYGGSVRVIARPGSAVRERSSAADAIIGLERAARLDSVAGYNGLADKADVVRRAFGDFLADAHASGALVAAYGAPVRGTTLLNSLGVTSQGIAFTVDRDPAKQQRYLPGCRIPVFAPEMLGLARPDLIVILPWPLRDEIVAQEASVRTWGGRFVVALPELRVLG